MQPTPKQRLTKAGLLLPLSAFFSLAFAVYSVFVAGAARADDTSTPLQTSLQTILKRVNGGAKFKPAAVEDVVAKALAFKALLTAEQQATLELAYTPALARRWSNLPCANTCRNGIGLGTLNAEQLTAALELIRAAAGTRANEGSDEFNQIRMADTILAAAQGSSGGGPGGGGGGGGFQYGEGNYYIAFLNTPSAKDPWMLQYGGHHYGANIAFNQGHVVATTPLFEALEPLSFDVQGTTYTPLSQERNALAAMLASLTDTQLAAAKLSQTFGDTTMSPGETNGGTGTFPATKVGLAVSSLSQAQKRLVLEAMKPWVQDMDDIVAANLLSIYQNELDGTYIAFTGNGVSGDATSFLVSNTNYARIDGPSVWIEFACQGGIVFRNQIHYHTVWRDHLRDYGKDLSLTTPLDSTADGAVSSGSAASYAAASLAPSSIGLLRGKAMAQTETRSPDDLGTGLPSILGDVEVQIRDSDGVTHSAPLYYVSPEQITFQTPAEASLGAASITVLQSGSIVGQGSAVLDSTAAGIFTANADGQGVLAGYLVRRTSDGAETQETLVTPNPDSGRYEPVPIDLGAEGDRLFVVAMGSGFRARASISATIGGESADIDTSGAQDNLTGLDQARIRIPRSLIGRGAVELVLSVDGKKTNTATIVIN